MAKWYNTSTGLEVPASSVRELQPGTGLFVHETTTTVSNIVERDNRGVLSYETIQTTTKIVDGYAVRLEDSETYDPNVNYLANQVLALQTAIRVRGGV